MQVRNAIPQTLIIFDGVSRNFRLLHNHLQQTKMIFTDEARPRENQYLVYV